MFTAALSNTLNADSVQYVMDQAVQKYGKPEITNSDQGSHHGGAPV